MTPKLTFEQQTGIEGRPFRLSASTTIEKGMAHTFKYLDKIDDYFTLFCDKTGKPYKKLIDEQTKEFLNV